MKFKEELGKHKVGVVMGSVLILGIIAYISRKRTTASTSQKFLTYSATTQETSTKETAQKRENWAKDFNLQLLTRASFLEFLRSLNKTLINSLKPLKDQHRHQRRQLRIEKSEQYTKCIEASIKKETEETENILKDLLQENKISRERFDKAMVLYRNDVEIIKTLEELNWEASKGLVPNEDIIAEILIFEIESLRKEKNILKKYILEDEVWEKWGVELGDVHLLAKELKKTKGLYLELQKLR